MAIIRALICQATLTDGVSHMKQLKLATLSAVFVAGLMLVACGGEKQEVKLTAQQETEMSARLAPAGEVAMASEVGAPSAAGAGGGQSGEEVYNTKCITCHGSGAAGAPKLGATAEWAPRVEKGIETLYTSAISGFNGMPPKGLCFDCGDDELKAAVDYMVEHSK